MRIAICDDEKAVRDLIRRQIEAQGGEHSIAEYASGEELLMAYDAPGWAMDLLFLDIAMKGADGIEVARRFRQAQADRGLAAWGSLPLIVFVTGFAEYMPDAFDVQAFQFIVKPIDDARFSEIFRQAERECSRMSGQRSRAAKTVTVGGMRTVAAGDICYIESVNHKNILCLPGERIEYYGRISDLERQLSPDFFRIHRGFLINLNRVSHYDRTDVYMEGGERLPLSRYKYQEFVKTWLRYLAEGGE